MRELAETRAKARGLLRGLVLQEVVIEAASRDLHSGLFGGAAMNPIRVLTRILGDLHDETGRVTLPGFYDGVEELPTEVAAQWRALEFDEKAYLGAVGLGIHRALQWLNLLHRADDAAEMGVHARRVGPRGGRGDARRGSGRAVREYAGHGAEPLRLYDRHAGHGHSGRWGTRR